jgi:hypothetical protein
MKPALMKAPPGMLGRGALALLAVGLFATAAPALDLTGTWVGSQTCTLITAAGDTDSTGKVKNLTLKIAQDAFDPTFHYMFFVETGRHYQGVVLDEAVVGAGTTLRAVATFVSCPTVTANPGVADLPPGSEMVNANFQFNKVGDKLAAGTSLVFAEDGSQQSCKWTTFKRMDTGVPVEATACP